MESKEKIIEFILKHKPLIDQKHLQAMNLEWLQRIKSEIDRSIGDKAEKQSEKDENNKGE